MLPALNPPWRIGRRGLLLAAPGLLLLRRTGLAAADGLPAARRTVEVAGPADLPAALAEAQPGDHLLLEDGVYPDPIELSARGTAEAPIVLRSARPGGARCTGEVRITGPHNVLLGLRLEGAEVELAADGARMSRCRQTDTRRIAVLVTRGHGIVIDHNELSGMRGRGISLRPGRRNADGLQGTHIHHNHIHDFRAGRAKENVHEGLQLGQGKSHSRISLKTLVEWNLLERVEIDSEAISIKSSDNVVRFNTILDSDAFLSNRHGRRNQIVANWIERSRGIAVQDRDNAVLGNVLVDTKSGLRIMGGDVAADGWPRGGTHPAAENTLVAANIADKVTVGYTFRNKQDAPALGTRLAGQDGEVELASEAKTEILPSAPPGIPKARRLSPAEVGPEAA